MKKFVLSVAIGLAAWAGNAAYLYWQVDSSAGDNSASSFEGYNAATIGYYEGSAADGTWLQNRTGKTELGTFDATGGSMGAPAAIDISSLTDGSYTFYIELVNYDSVGDTLTHVAYGEEFTYQQLVDKGFVGTDLKPSLVSAAWHGGTYHAVPEPTGALMLVIGMAFLGLKRRHV